MQEMLHGLGLDWKLLLAQAVNFFILLVVLRLTVYKPLLRFLAKRRREIEEGIAKTEEARRRLEEIAELKKAKMKEAEGEVAEILSRSEARAKEEAQRIMDAAARKEAEMIKIAHEEIGAEKAAERKRLREESVALVKDILVKAVEMDPKKIDDALIEKAAKENVPA